MSAVTFCTIIYMAQAFMDVVIDGLTVVQQKIDQERGSNDLQSLAWGSYVVGGLLFGFFTMGFLARESEKSIFFMTGILGIVVTIASLGLNKKLEDGE